MAILLYMSWYGHVESTLSRMYDDIAYNHENPTPGGKIMISKLYWPIYLVLSSFKAQLFATLTKITFLTITPGKIINHPNGTDVYHGVPKDYVCGSVRPDLFLQVSQYYNWVKMTIMDGRMWQRFDFNAGCRCWKEKRSMVYLELAKLLIQVPSSSSSWLLVLLILSIAGPKDNVFVYFADHGAKVKDYHVYPSTFITIKIKHDHHLQGLVAFGQDVLKATALNQAIKDMHAAKKYFLSSGW